LRYFFEITYNGSNYHGWQVQHNAISVQQVLQDKLSQLINTNVEITGSGRTDTGVHARQQFFHLDMKAAIDRKDFKYHLNAILPRDIAVLDIVEVTHNAHARFDAICRAYSYEITQEKNPFKIQQSYLYHRHLDIDLLNIAANLLKGKHNFKSFSKVKTQVNNFNCEVFDAFWQQDHEVTSFKIEANRFLRGMVRAIVGTLLMVNEKKIQVEDLREILASMNRSSAGRSVPPEGLFLSKIVYPEHIYLKK